LSRCCGQHRIPHQRPHPPCGAFHIMRCQEALRQVRLRRLRRSDAPIGGPSTRLSARHQRGHRQEKRPPPHPLASQRGKSRLRNMAVSGLSPRRVPASASCFADRRIISG
jgi:hypothetical protein